MHASSFLGFRKGFLGVLCGIGLLGSASAAHAAGWVEATSPSTSLMLGMDCSSPSECVAVGVGGAMMRTSDIKTWSTVSSGVTSNLWEVDFSGQTGFAVGDSGVILKSSDYGKTWTKISGVTTEGLLGVSVVSSSVAYVAGQNGAVFRTTDGGTTWTSLSSGLSSLNAYAIDAYSATGVYVAGKSGVAYRSTDAGVTWTAVTTGTTSSIYTIDALSSTMILMGGENRALVKSTNGTTFSALSPSSLGSTESIFDVSCSSTSLCLVMGSAGSVMSSTNGGSSWTKETIPGGYALGALANYSTGRRYLTGATGSIIIFDNYGPSTITGLALTSGGASTTDTTPDVTWTATTDNEASVASYEIDIDGTGTYTNIGNVTSYALTSALSIGSHTIAVVALDTVGNKSNPASLTFTVAAVDTVAPTVGAVSPAAATEGIAVTFSVSAADDGLSSCSLYVGGVNQGTMSMDTESPTFVKSYTFTSSGTYSAYATCVDASGNIGTGATTSVVVSAESSADTTAPVVGSVTPTSIVSGVETVLSVTFSDSVGVTSCTIFDGGSPASMIVGASNATYTQTFDGVGSHTMYALCSDAAGNIGTGATTTVEVVSSGADTTAPTVGSITPTTATVGVSVSFVATVSDDVGISSCYLVVNGASQGPMTIASGKASRAYTPTAVGTLAVYALCKDTSGNLGSEMTTSVAVSSASTDTTAPTVGTLSPLTAVAGVSTTFSATYSDAVGVVSCTGYANGGTPAMALSSGTASVSGKFESAGSYPAYVTCVDAAGNVGTGATVTIVVSAASTDTTAPTVGVVSPTTATQNSAVTFSVTATDASGIYGCYLMVDGNAQGAMTASSSTYSRSYTPASSGTLSVYAWCGDVVGNVGTGATVSVAVAAAAETETDTVAPTVGAIAPLTATEDTAVTLYASVADSGGMDTCTLYVNSTNIGSMDISDGYASRSYTFDDEGDAVANAYCVDAAGNATRGASSTITISAAVSSEEEGAVSEADIDTLIKLACGTDADAEDPCHAVYYYNGTRHAFPNEKAYFTWYSDFDDVIIVTQDFLASITLGANVTYHPGSRMVKFVTQNTVYAVGEEGELRAIASEEVAESIWGSAWNTLIDDISDAFYGNYSFGDEIDSTSDFDPEDVEDSVTSIDEILE